MLKIRSSRFTIVRHFHSLKVFASLVLLGLAGATSLLANSDHHGPPAFFYQQTNLVSDEAGVAQVQDPNLVNAWGISFGPTGPFWVSANQTGRSMIYSVTNDSTGAPHVTKAGLEVNIPGEGSVTGQVFNNTTNFNGDLFLFVNEDGTISGWRPAIGTAAEVLTIRSNAVYKGVALASTAAGSMLLAANFSEGTVDVYDGALNLVAQLSDTNAPDGYAPFNVQNIKGFIFVTFAKQDDDKEDDVAGPGNGLIDILVLPTGRFHRFVTGSDAGGRLKSINSPWGVALAPKSFGIHGGQLLVGNFGSGTIMAFDEHGHFRGLLESRPGKPIAIEGLWGLSFGNCGQAGVTDTLYFSAGPEDETHGLFGSLEPVRLKKPHGPHDDHDNHGHDR